jgi:hypothetical protein
MTFNKQNPAATPFHEENLMSLQGNLAAFSQLLKLAKKPKRIIEARGGLGHQTRRLMAQWPGVPIEAWERDPTCAKELKRIAGVVATEGEYPEDKQLKPTDLCVIDGFWTLKNFDTYLPYFHNGAGQYIFTDLARGKLHLHPKAYGLERGEWYLYINELSKKLVPLGLTVVDHAKAPRSISYFLVRR